MIFHFWFVGLRSAYPIIIETGGMYFSLGSQGGMKRKYIQQFSASGISRTSQSLVSSTNILVRIEFLDVVPA